ncbi:MAG TPA: glycosyltransferase family 4 protein, partial [Acidimicrobiia bacterium]
DAVIVGEGYCREQLETQIRNAAAEAWIMLPGRVSEEEKVDLYRRAWVLASASAREGWGMTITEAAACGTPSVVTNVAGHADAVVDGVTGLLADLMDDFRAALGAVLRDRGLRERLGVAAREHAARYTWEASARGTLQVLADAALAHHPRT